ncbi:hypothetical protein EYR41_004498 [Orbilia oligospora]|uniref:Uncharacterized protein n=1 Tax=Orbilia oligospora TaxID=2813651 RepID=A0A7C8PE67_ORBOL|nr:hypothetical protein TWF751_009801 [Orbilia oligospora]TGJ72616.1 hypothetical protein EYR41_004498 [Orbilia oligospora]
MEPPNGPTAKHKLGQCYQLCGMAIDIPPYIAAATADMYVHMSISVGFIIYGSKRMRSLRASLLYIRFMSIIT